MADQIPFVSPRLGVAPPQCRGVVQRIVCPLCAHGFDLVVYVGHEQDFFCPGCGRALAGYQPAGNGDADREPSTGGPDGAA